MTNKNKNNGANPKKTSTGMDLNNGTTNPSQKYPKNDTEEKFEGLESLHEINGAPLNDGNNQVKMSLNFIEKYLNSLKDEAADLKVPSVTFNENELQSHPVKNWLMNVHNLIVRHISERSPLQKIDEIKIKAEALREQINCFAGTKGDKQFLYLEEMLVKLILELDNIDVNDDNDARIRRKQVLLDVKAVLIDLEDRAEQN